MVPTLRHRQAGAMTETPSSGTTSAGPPPPEADQGFAPENLTDYRSLRRSRFDRKIAGVAGGLGRHLGIDPTILRVLFVVLAFFGGAGIVMYAAAWLLVPEEDTGRSVMETSDATRNALLIGAAVLGVLIVLTGWHWDGLGLLWLGLIALVLVLAFNRSSSSAAPPTGVSTSSTADTETTPSWYPPTGPVPPAPTPKRPKRSGPLLFGPTLALIALSLGALGLYDTSGGAVADVAYPVLALAVTGAMLVVGAFVGRPGGLIALGVIALVTSSVMRVGDLNFTGDQDEVLRPAVATSVQNEYRMPAGRLELDLRRVSDLEELNGRTVEIDGNVGEIVVVLPRDLAATVDARTNFGSIDIGGASSEGINLTRVTDVGDPGDAVAEIDLVLQMRAGHIEVRQ